MGDNLPGLIVAAMSVVSSGMQQIFCRTMQQKHKLSSHELLSNTAPAQASITQAPPLQFAVVTVFMPILAPMVTWKHSVCNSP